VPLKRRLEHVALLAVERRDVERVLLEAVVAPRLQERVDDRLCERGCLQVRGGGLWADNFANRLAVRGGTRERDTRVCP
jgi:hypothetical protein